MRYRTTRRTALQLFGATALGWGIAEGLATPDWDVTSRSINRLTDSRKFRTPPIVPAGNRVWTGPDDEPQIYDAIEIVDETVVGRATDRLIGFSMATGERELVVEDDRLSLLEDVTIDTGLAYQATKGAVVGLDINNEQPASYSAPGSEVGEVAVHEAVVCVTTEGTVRAYDRKTGNQLWQVEDIDNVVDVMHDSILLGRNEQTIIADVTTGTEHERLDHELWLQIISEGWLGSDLQAGVLSINVDETAFVTLDSGVIRGYTQSWDQRWSRSLENATYDFMNDDRLYISLGSEEDTDTDDLSQRILGIDLGSGQTAIDLTAEYGLEWSDDGAVLSDGTVQKIAPTGTVAWEFDPAGTPRVHTSRTHANQETIVCSVVTNGEIEIVGLASQSGEVRWQTTVPLAEPPTTLTEIDLETTSAVTDSIALFQLDDQILAIHVESSGGLVENSVIGWNEVIDPDPVALVESRLYLSGQESDQILAADISTGNRVRLPATLIEIDAIAGTTVYGWTDEDFLICFASETGQQWETDFDIPRDAETNVLPTPEAVWVSVDPADADDETEQPTAVIALDSDTGDVRRSFQSAETVRPSNTTSEYGPSVAKQGTEAPEQAVLWQPLDAAPPVVVSPAGTVALEEEPLGNDITLISDPPRSIVLGSEKTVAATVSESGFTKQWEYYIDRIADATLTDDNRLFVEGVPGIVLDTQTGQPLWRTGQPLTEQLQTERASPKSTDWLTSVETQPAWLDTHTEAYFYHLDGKLFVLDERFIRIDSENQLRATLDQIATLRQQYEVPGPVARRVDRLVQSTGRSEGDTAVETLRTVNQAYQLVAVTAQLWETRQTVTVANPIINLLAWQFGRDSALRQATEALAAGSPRRAYTYLYEAAEAWQRARAFFLVAGTGLVVLLSAGGLYRLESRRTEAHDRSVQEAKLRMASAGATTEVISGPAAQAQIRALTAHLDGDVDRAESALEEGLEFADHEQDLLEQFDHEALATTSKYLDELPESLGEDLIERYLSAAEAGDADSENAPSSFPEESEMTPPDDADDSDSLPENDALRAVAIVELIRRERFDDARTVADIDTSD